jgi:hypothetical protein
MLKPYTDKYGYVWKMSVACRLYVGLTWIYLKCSQAERPIATLQKWHDIKTFHLQITIQNNKDWTTYNFHVIWLCHERHGIYSLWVDSCSWSCRTLTKQVFLNLIKAYTYQATFLYFGYPSCLCSDTFTNKYQHSLHVLINAQVTDIYGRGGKEYVLRPPTSFVTSSFFFFFFCGWLCAVHLILVTAIEMKIWHGKFRTGC